MKYYTRGYRHMDVVKSDLPEIQVFEVKRGVGSDDSILQDIFAPDPLTGNPSSDIFVEASHVNDALREYIVNVLRSPISEGPRVSSADDALQFARGIDETRMEYINRIVELTKAE